MDFEIRFGTTNNCKKKIPKTIYSISGVKSAPRKSVVQVYFAARNMTLAYYNDRFDLHCGDIVYVDGKLAGLRGRVTEVNYNFKIKVADYKRVISVADTDVHGQFFMDGSHFVTFERETLPRSKVLTWYSAPAMDDEFVSGSDNTSFSLNTLSGMGAGSEVVARGGELYRSNKVKYLCVDGINGYAIVEGSKFYEVEFKYCNGEISRLTCSCFCSGCCKHEVAAILQLRETLELIEKHYSDKWHSTDYFAAVLKGDLFTYAIDAKATGKFTL